MLSLRQMEALVWVAHLGTFVRAASKLSTTQSAISKRITEMEETLGFAVFDRSKRNVQLTLHGEEVLEIARRMLQLRDDMTTIGTGASSTIRQRVRIGVTELTAMTWLPQLICELRVRYPSLVVELEVANGRSLYESLESGQLDIIVCPEFLRGPKVAVVPLADVEIVWMAQAGLIEHHRVLSLKELISYSLIMQGERSGVGSYLTRWLLSEDHEFEQVLITDSLMAVVGMTVAGLGISLFPRLCFEYLIDNGKLQIVRTRPAIPLVSYASIYHKDHPSKFTKVLANLMRDTCDFSVVI